MKKAAAGLLALTLAIGAGMSAQAYTGASAWAEAELDKAVSYSLMPEILRESDVSKPINRLEFAAVSVKLYEAFGGAPVETMENPFTDTDNAEVVRAYHAGITTGISETTFGPDALLSREQAATMLTRVYAAVDKTADWTVGMTETFADDADISDWARESVYFMYAKGIIAGVGGNKFAPKNVTPEQESALYANSTREQSLALAVRMYEKLKPETGKLPVENGQKEDSKNPENDKQTQPEDKQNPEDNKEDLFACLPPITFGTEIDRYTGDGNATVILQDVTLEEYTAYVKLMDMSFPTNLYLLEAGQYSKKSTDGEYIMTVSWSGGNMSIAIERDLGA